MLELPDHWLVEITRVGGWLRVAVLDPKTGREAVVHGPAGAAESELVRLAARRLEPLRPPPRSSGIVA